MSLGITNVSSNILKVGAGVGAGGLITAAGVPAIIVSVGAAIAIAGVGIGVSYAYYKLSENGSTESSSNLLNSANRVLDIKRYWRNQLMKRDSDVSSGTAS